VVGVKASLLSNMALTHPHLAGVVMLELLEVVDADVDASSLAFAFALLLPLKGEAL